MNLRHEWTDRQKCCIHIIQEQELSLANSFFNNTKELVSQTVTYNIPCLYFSKHRADDHLRDDPKARAHLVKTSVEDSSKQHWHQQDHWSLELPSPKAIKDTRLWKPLLLYTIDFSSCWNSYNSQSQQSTYFLRIVAEKSIWVKISRGLAAFCKKR